MENERFNFDKMIFSKHFQTLFTFPLVLSTIGYIFLIFLISRTHFYQFFGIYTVLFGIYWWVFQQKQHFSTNQAVKILIGFAIFIRFLLVFSTPELSDDYHRFFWDGTLFNNSFNPYEHLPSHFIETHKEITNLHIYNQLNSPNYFTIYPPICQYIFGLGAYIFPENEKLAVIVMKFCMFLMECGTLFLISRLLLFFNQKKHFLLLYALNPLIIIEISGNLHFEGAMIFFICLAIYFLTFKRLLWSSFAMAAAVCSKLLPLMFLPFFLIRLGVLKSIKYYILVFLGVLVLFYPFLSHQLLENIGESASLYFSNFQFNGSIFYLLDFISWQIYGYSKAYVFGGWLPYFSLFFILLLWVLELIFYCKKNGFYYLKIILQKGNNEWKRIFGLFLLSMTIYFGFSGVVHPWYIAPLVLFSVFSGFRYPILWSWLIGLTYYTYLTDAYVENKYFIFVEYFLVFTFLVYELYSKRKELFLK